ncbi:serine hydrolase [Psychroserpens sp. BH13MA-6]
MKKNIVYLVCYLIGFIAVGQSKEAAAIDSLFMAWELKNEPGCAVSIIKNGETIYEKGFGLANLEQEVGITPTSKFYIASNSKQFTAFCALLLEEQGLLDLDQPIQTYLPDFPEYEWPITPRHLIHHTNGFRDYLHLLYLKGKDLMNEISEEEVYDMIKNQKSLNHQPGDKFLYNNSGYFLLGRIIEKVSGQSLKDFAHTHIFEPLGMNDTFYYDDNTVLVSNRAHSYNKTDGGFKNLTTRFQLVGSGGIYSTVEDLALWDHNFDDNELGKGADDIISKMYSEGLFNNGQPCGYAFGLRKNTYKGIETLSHGGSLEGYRSAFLRFPEEKLSIIILANRDDAMPMEKAHTIADLFLDIKKAPKAAPEENVAKTTDKFQLEQLVGHYELRPGMLVEITLKNEELWLHQKWNDRSYTIVNRSGNTYGVPNEETIVFEFSTLEHGAAQRLKALQGDKTTIAKRTLESNEPTDIKAYIGKYYNDELDITYEVSVLNDELIVKIPYFETLKLKSIAKDAFVTYYGAQVRFTRTNGAVTAFMVDSGRVNGLSFIKQ